MSGTLVCIPNAEGGQARLIGSENGCWTKGADMESFLYRVQL